MSFKEKLQGWINYSDDNYIDGAEENFDDFDFQPGAEPQPQPQPQHKSFSVKPGKNNVVNINSAKPNQSAQPSVVFKQISRFEDVNKVADVLKQRRIVVLNLEDCPAYDSQRIIDVLYGVSYAGDGDFKKIASSAYVITPNNISVTGELGMDLMEQSDNI